MDVVGEEGGDGGAGWEDDPADYFADDEGV